MRTEYRPLVPNVQASVQFGRKSLSFRTCLYLASPRE